MLASLVKTRAKRAVKAEGGFALLEIEYTQTCEELGDGTQYYSVLLLINQPARQHMHSTRLCDPALVTIHRRSRRRAP